MTYTLIIQINYLIVHITAKNIFVWGDKPKENGLIATTLVCALNIHNDIGYAINKNYK